MKPGRWISTAAGIVSILLISACATTVQTREDTKPAEKEAREEELATRMERRIETLMKQMSLSEKIGMRFIGWVPGRQYTEEIESLITEEHLSGFILYKNRNYTSAEEFEQLTTRLQQTAAKQNPSIELFIAVDQEGGRVAAFRYPHLVRFPAPFQWGKYNDTRFARSVGYITGVEIKQLGCNMNLAPVLDIYSKADSTIIGDRSMGNNPWLVSRLGTAYIEGIQEAGVIPVAKHFPGHGVTTIDSHSALPVVDISYEQMKLRELVPFQTVIENGVPAIMTAHILYPQIDEQYPATLSPTIVKSILRKKLNFDGVVISDAFSMGAITREFDTRTALRQCIKAGVDLILVDSSFDVVSLKQQVLSMVRSGEITREEIERGVRRILTLKASYDMIHQ